jgi:hypothetical protein
MEAYWERGGIAPRILDLGTKWKWMASFTPRPLHPQGNTPGTHWIGAWVDPRASLEAVVRRKIPRPYRNSKAQLSSPQPSAVPLSYIDSLFQCIWILSSLAHTTSHFNDEHKTKAQRQWLLCDVHDRTRNALDNKMKLCWHNAPYFSNFVTHTSTHTSTHTTGRPYTYRMTTHSEAHMGTCTFMSFIAWGCIQKIPD